MIEEYVFNEKNELCRITEELVQAEEVWDEKIEERIQAEKSFREYPSIRNKIECAKARVAQTYAGIRVKEIKRKLKIVIDHE